MKNRNSKALFERAKTLIPGGVNSPVRAFKSVGGDPIFMSRAKGAYLYDEDDNSYIDLINSWGPMILGHANEEVEKAIFEAVKSSTSFGAPGRREVEIAELIIDMVPSIEKIRMVNSGTEATMSAIRLARGYTGKNKFIKFEGCYHGHGDAFLVAAGSGAATLGVPDSPGVTKGTSHDTLLAPYNDLKAIDRVLAENEKEICAIIVEPVAGNMGCVLPNNDFLEGLRARCDAHQILLIFDEVMTGFRLSAGGAQELLGVKPDLTTFGKIIGGGLPVGAYGGSREIMNQIAPEGPIYQAGTLSGNPVAMAAGMTILRKLREHPEIYKQVEQTTRQITTGITKILSSQGLKYTINQIGSMYSLFFTDQKVTNFEIAKSTDAQLFGAYFRGMLSRGIYLAPSQFESLFISNVIQSAEVAAILKATEEVLVEMHEMK
ncbi:MAG: glutamate-1-semialdehyde 2,1-aminomutase [Cytophagales bacterium]|tara:strand:- start:5433 stop:6731 length:1299 start_codon:yes stop_codon:yes gene_type:complete